MNEASPNIIIQTGTDPRRWPEFGAIREEINKINHPARPEVNWRLIESLALTLFRTNGVDLQTAVYYALARTQKHGLAGFTESCELLAGMVVSQWEQLWPVQQQARTEILEWFNARVGNQLRQHEFENDDLRLVYRAERALQLLCDKLQQVELKRVPRIENMLYLMQNTAKRIEAAHEAAKQPPAEALKMPPMVYLSVPESEPIRTIFSAVNPLEKEKPLLTEEQPPQEALLPNEASLSKESLSLEQEALPKETLPPEQETLLEETSPPEQEPSPQKEQLPQETPKPNVEVRIAVPVAKRFSAIWSFGSGVLCSLLISVVVYFVQIKPMQQQLVALAEKPEGSVQLWLTDPNITTYRQQLNNLENLSPLAGLRTASASVAMARQLWPKAPDQEAESQRWERLLQARIDIGVVDSSYFQLQQRLQALSAKLLEQEQAHGSLTISYLKTAIYQMQSELNREIPLEELLRQLAVSVEKHQPASPVLLKQIDERWNALLSRYHQLTLQAEPVR